MRRTVSWWQSGTGLRFAAVLSSFVLVGATASSAGACPPANWKVFHQAEVSVPVTVPGDTGTYHIRGQLSWYGDLDPHRPMQVLVAGMSYSSQYWDFMAGYSYVRASKSVVFNYDQLGTTASADHPPMDKLSLVNQAEVLDQVVLALKSGVRGKEGRRTVSYRSRGLMIVTGHSLGAAEALVLAATHPAHIDGVIATSYLHYANATVAAALGALRVPSRQTDKFADAAWTDGSVTTADGHRDVFYYLPGASRKVIALDEDRKAVSPVPTAAQAQYLRTTGVELTSAITAPVLMAVGQFDSLNCNAAPDQREPALDCSTPAAIMQRERLYFAKTCVQAYVAPGAGHVLNLHYAADEWFDAANRWIDQLASHHGRSIRC